MDIIINETSLNSTEEVEECEDWSLLDQPRIRYTIIVLYVFVLFVCLLGNTFTIIVICVHRYMRTATNFFLANLAFADLFVAVFCIGQNMFHIVGSENGHWPLGHIICKLYVFVLHVVPCTSIGILVCVSLEKYIAVLHPLLAMKVLTPKLRVVMMIAIWVVSLTVNSPYFFTTTEKRFGAFAACSRDMEGYKLRLMITVSFVVWYCIPLATIAFLYARIGMVLWNGALRPLEIRYSNDMNGTTLTVNYEADRRMLNGNGIHNNHSNHLMLSVRASNNAYESTRSHDEHHTSSSSELLESRKKIIRLLIAIVCSFAILTFPNHARLLNTAWSGSHQCNSTFSSLLQPICYLCLFISSSVNPFLYAFMSQRFREAVLDIINCRIGARQRKYTRTRTFLSEYPETAIQSAIHSRSPSLSRVNLNNNYKMIHVKSSHTLNKYFERS
uniref:G-protein coupled receptors family 1 profile domain-containing protein n=1 Tax=Acrobeloides nanus TaxID=290746 RepID=A0A914C3V9_9BILA